AGAHLQRQAPRAEALAEGEAGPLVMAVDLFQEDAHDRAVGLVADEELLLERAELAAGQVAHDACGRLPHLVVGEEHGRRLEFGNLLGFDHDAAATLRISRTLPHRGNGRRMLVPLVAAGMPHKLAWAEPLQAAGAVPGSLI